MTYPPPQPHEQAYAQPVYQQPFAPAQGASRAPGPFAGIRWTDFVRDGAAALLLLVSLALPWDYDHAAAERIDVLLLTLLSVFALAAMYLHRLHVLAPSVSASTVATVRALIVAPYVVMVLVYLGLGTARSFNGEVGSTLGVAMAVGLAGAALAAPPRECELTATSRARLADVWRIVTLAAAGVFAAAALIGLVAFAVMLWGSTEMAQFFPVVTLTAWWLNFIVGIVFLAVLALPAWRRSESGRVAVIAAAGAWGGATLIDLFSGWDLGSAFEVVEASPLLTLPLLTLGALYLAPSVREGMAPAPGIYRFLPAASHVLLGAGILNLSFALVLVGLAAQLGLGASLTTVLVLTVLQSAVLIVTRVVLRRDPFHHRNAVLALLVGVTAIGLVIIIVSATSGDTAPLTRHIVAVTFAVPVAVALLMLAPASMREYYAPLRTIRMPGAAAAPGPAGPGASVASSPAVAPVAAATVAVATVAAAPVAVTPEPPAPPAPPVDPYLAAVHDPRTDAATLHRIAAEAPWLRAHVAVHPQAYPDLLAWLASLGDPVIDAALAQRRV